MTWGVQNTEGDAHKQLSYALQDMGLNFMDTAEIYPVPPRYAYFLHIFSYTVCSRRVKSSVPAQCCMTTDELLQCGDSGQDRPVHFNLAEAAEA